MWRCKYDKQNVGVMVSNRYVINASHYIGSPEKMKFWLLQLNFVSQSLYCHIFQNGYYFIFEVQCISCSYKYNCKYYFFNFEMNLFSKMF